MCPNCSSCNKTVTLGWKISIVPEWIVGERELVIIDLRAFWDSQTILMPLIYQYLTLTLKPIHYHIILQIEASF